MEQYTAQRLAAAKRYANRSRRTVYLEPTAYGLAITTRQPSFVSYYAIQPTAPGSAGGVTFHERKD